MVYVTEGFRGLPKALLPALIAKNETTDRHRSTDSIIHNPPPKCEIASIVSYDHRMTLHGKHYTISVNPLHDENAFDPVRRLCTHRDTDGTRHGRKGTENG